MPPELVREAVLYGITPGGKQEILAEIADNWKRCVHVQLEKVLEVCEIKLEIISTYGAERAEVFEIKVY